MDIQELITPAAIKTGVGLIVLFFAVVIMAKMLIHICPANGILVISGRERTVDGKKYGFRIVKGGWTVVIPYLERIEVLDMGIIPVNVRVEGVQFRERHYPGGGRHSLRLYRRLRPDVALQRRGASAGQVPARDSGADASDHGR